jgi:hypothetical protein
MTNHARGQFRCWRSRKLGKHAGAQEAPAPPVHGQARSDGPGVDTAPGDPVAAAMQLAVGLLTASLDSPELEAWALPALVPPDADGLGNLMAGLHLISMLVIRQLHQATGEPPEVILQRLAIMAERRRGLPSTG